MFYILGYTKITQSATTTITTKKELLILVLKKMESSRDLIPGILALIESSYVDEKMIDGLLQLISTSIKSIKKEDQKQILQKGIEAIKKIKAIEDTEKVSDEELDNLLAGI